MSTQHKCALPPAGWYCTRAPGHDGPCAAHPGIRPQRVYVGGPMTGHPELNFPAFHARTAHLRAEGYEVINPAEVNPDPATPYAECMRKDLAVLLTCDRLELLPGWHKSRGACAEWFVADICGLTIAYPANEPTLGELALMEIRDAVRTIALQVLA